MICPSRNNPVPCQKHISEKPHVVAIIEFQSGVIASPASDGITAITTRSAMIVLITFS